MTRLLRLAYDWRQYTICPEDPLVDPRCSTVGWHIRWLAVVEPLLLNFGDVYNTSPTISLNALSGGSPSGSSLSDQPLVDTLRRLAASRRIKISEFWRRVIQVSYHAFVWSRGSPIGFSLFDRRLIHFDGLRQAVESRYLNFGDVSYRSPTTGLNTFV